MPEASLAPAAAPIYREWTSLMRRGDFAAAWRLCDALVAAQAGRPCDERPRHCRYVWDGSPLPGKRVLLRCYHGLGDTIQFVRYAPLVRALARETILWAQPSLLPLLRTVRGVDRVLPLHDGEPRVGFDVDVELMELPHVFRTTLDSIPCNVPYLQAAPANRPTGRALQVGLVWAAGGWDHARTVLIQQVAPLAHLPGVQWHLLQDHRQRAEWAHGPAQRPRVDTPERLAAVMRALDLIVTVDSFPAHLAGAFGVPVWTLLPYDADWRWLEARTDSPWYPTMRLFRQPRPGDWRSVIAEVAEAIDSGSLRSPV
jgi:hypothetical protein